MNVVPNLVQNNPVAHAFFQQANLCFVEKSITDILAVKGAQMWENIEKSWGRGPICKPTIIPDDGREFVARAVNLLLETQFSNTPENLQYINRYVIDHQVQEHLTAAREAFYYQKALYRDHPIYARRDTAVRERPKGVYFPLSAGSYSLSDPIASYKQDYWEAYARLSC